MAFVYEATGRRDPYQCHAHLFLRRASPASLCPVSYTHLTLPTIYSV